MFDDFQDMDEVEQGFASSYESDEALGEPEGLVEPRHSNFFVGHESAQERLLSLINSGAMPHAMIFSGTQGIGKSTLAFRLARTLLKHGTPDSNQDSLFGDAAPADITSLSIDADDPVFSKVAAGGHPDLLTIEPLEGKKSLDVNTARKVAPFLRMTSADGGWRVVIVDDADTKRNLKR
jgi:DNA polymerase-3 subunit delta'